MDNKTKVIAVIEESLELTQPITDTRLRFREDLHADSVDMVSMGLLLEEALSVDIDERQLQTLLTVQDVIDWIDQEAVDRQA